MSLIVTIETEYGYITRNGVTTFEPELWEQLTETFEHAFDESEEE